MSQDNKVWIFGKHAVQAVVLAGKRKIYRLLLTAQNKEFASKISYELDSLGIKIETVNKDYFTTLFGKDTVHQGCAAQVEAPKQIFLEDLEDDDRPIVFLDQVEDPQNIGSITRAAAVFGAKAIVLPEAHSPKITSVITKVASGAAEIIPIIKVPNIVQAMKMLKEDYGYWSIGLDERGDKEIQNIDISGKFVLVIGSEGAGMRRLTRENCDFLAKIPSWSGFSTLNAAQAATVSLYEILRQKRSSK